MRVRTSSYSAAGVVTLRRTALPQRLNEPLFVLADVRPRIVFIANGEALLESVRPATEATATPNVASATQPLDAINRRETRAELPRCERRLARTPPDARYKILHSGIVAQAPVARRHPRPL